MTTIKTSELTGPELDWAVAKCEGFMRADGGVYCGHHGNIHKFKPSKTWSQGGPIIERKKISLFDLPSGLDIAAHPTFKEGDIWEAEIIPHGEDSILYCGPTPLIAACRCYVASKLGDTVEVPDELIQGAN